MRKTTSFRQSLQTNSRERRSRRKLYRGLTPNQNSTLRIVTAKILASGGCCKMTVDNLAAHCGISSSQFRRDIDVLVSKGFIIRIRRPRFRNRSETNLLMLPVVSRGGVGVINDKEKQKNLKPNTNTAREVPRVKSYTQLKWEWNRARHKHRPSPYVGRCRMTHLEALRVSSGAAVGTWDDETKRLLREQEARYAAWDREGREYHESRRGEL